MRVLVMFLFIAITVPCHAEDPLESLNTVEDTLSTMQRALRVREENRNVGAALAEAAMQRLPEDDHLYFVADEEIGSNGWLGVRPCTEELAANGEPETSQSCVRQSDGSVVMGSHYWKSRSASAADLRPGALVVIRDESGDGWFLSRITDLAALGKGEVGVSAPFTAALKGLRLVE
uniref:SH3 domain-containing protein n=1 Tax=Geobacter sp. (strain M21) TaxID=443144 RepID=C6E349_GEOSM